MNFSHDHGATTLFHLSRAAVSALAAGCLLVLPVIANPFAETGSHARFYWLAACAVLIAFAGALTWAERPGDVNGLAVPWPLRWLFILVGWIFLTACISIEPVTAWLGDTARREGALSWGFAALVAAAVWRTSAQERNWRDWCALLSMSSTVPALATVFQFIAAGMSLTTTLTGTLGNPVFLGALMMLAMPLSLAQWLAGATSRVRFGWAALAGLQTLALVLSLARGPLIGAVIAAWSLLLWAGLALKRRPLVIAACAAPVLLLIFFAVISYLAALPEASPQLARFQFKSNSSSEARLGIWAAGMALFADAGLMRQLSGFGVDTGIMTHMSHMPAWVYRIEGLGMNVDRMHSQTLETLINAGVVGAVLEFGLFTALVHSWLQRAGLGVRWPVVAGVSLGSGAVLGMAGASLAGLATLPSSFAIGIAGGWLALFFVRQVIETRRGAGAATAQPGQILGVAIGLALIACWIESQLGVNDITVRVFTFALIGLQCAQGAYAGSASALVAETATALATEPVLPPLRLDSIAWTALPAIFLAWAPPQTGGGIWLGANPSALMQGGLLALAMALFALLYERYGAVPSVPAAPMKATRSNAAWWLFAALVPLYGLGHFLLIGTLAGMTLDSVVSADSTALLFLTSMALALLVMLIVALTLFAGVAHAPLARFSHAPLMAGAVAFIGLVAVAAAAHLLWLDVRADTLARHSIWSTALGRGDTAAGLADRATESAPRTRGLWTALARAHFGEAFRAAQNNALLVESRKTEVQLHAAKAQQALDRALELGRRDPFVWALRGELNTFKAAPYAAEFFGGDAARKGLAQEARLSFEKSLASRSNHPYTLRGLIRVELDYGSIERATILADQLIASDPKSEIGYEERALIALRANDNAGFAAALRNGIEKTGGAASLRRPLAEFLFRQGDVPGATREMEQLVAKTPQDWYAARDLIRLYLRQNANDKALALAQSARNFVPEQERASLEDLLRNLAPRPFTGGGLKP